MIHIVEEHSRQLAHLFQTKADLAAINTILSEKDSRIFTDTMLHICLFG